MNTDIAYKGLKYIIVWILIYLAIKYASNYSMSEVDIILVATVLTLLLCILENMLLGPNRFHDVDYFGNVDSIIGSDNENSNRSRSNTFNRSTQSDNSMMFIKEDGDVNSGIGSSIGSSIGSIGSSISYTRNNSMSSTSSSNSSNQTSQSIPLNRLVATNYEVTPRVSPVSTTAPGNFNNPTNTSTIQEDVFNGDVTPANQAAAARYTGSDYLGQTQVVEPNQFGGPNNQLNQSGTDASLGGTNAKPLVVRTPDLSGTNHLHYPPIPSNNAQIALNNAMGLTATGAIDSQIDSKMDDVKISIPRVDARSDVIDTKITEKVVRPDTQILSQPLAPVVTQEGVVNSDAYRQTLSNDSMFDNPEASQRLSLSGKPLKWYEQSFNPRSYSGAENLDQIGVSDGRSRDDILVNDMIYSDFNRMPPSFNDRDFEYGYSFLPPKDWYPLPPYPPVCVSYQEHSPHPVYIDGTTMDLKEWHETKKITPPDSMNTSYITNELNSKV